MQSLVHLRAFPPPLTAASLPTPARLRRQAFRASDVLSPEQEELRPQLITTVNLSELIQQSFNTDDTTSKFTSKKQRIPFLPTFVCEIEKALLVSDLCALCLHTYGAPHPYKRAPEEPLLLWAPWPSVWLSNGCSSSSLARSFILD